MKIYEDVVRDTATLKKMYGDNITVEIGDEYYVVYFWNSVGQFKFLVSDDKLHKPFALSYVSENVSKAIELLQEV